MTQTVDTSPLKSTRRFASGITARPAPPLWWAIVQLGALGFHLPLSILTGSQSSMASTNSVLMIGSMVSIGGIIVYWLLARLLSTKWAALAAASVVIVFFWHWDSGDFGPIAAFAIFGVVLAAAVKFSPNHYFKVAAFLASVTLSATMGVLFISDSIDEPAQVTGVQNPVGEVALESLPDIVLVVLDGYARDDVMRDFYEFDNTPFLDDLRGQGFDVATRAVANYSITHLSIPAMLNMSYVHPDGAAIGNADLIYLADEIAGSNDFVELLKENGYTYVHGEGDHWINRCGNNVDVCLPGPPLDITGWALLQRTPIGPFFYRETGDPTTHLNVERIEDLQNWSSAVGNAESPTFAFVHIQLPHPPLFLDTNCSVRIDSLLDGRIMYDGQIPPAHLDMRKRAWVEQVRCANSTITEFVESLDPETIVVIASDHGPDSVFQFEPIASDLTADQLYERYSTLTAVRLPESCKGSLPNDVDTVNTFRVVLSCLADEEVPLLESRSYLGGFSGPIQEVKLPTDNADG
jgi:hypothetical protein